ncbi:hypothetical protein, partial [Litoribacterium kuwaitense]|uniref:hypothetical protein n=1 Tax=Litoribacterium kuwaitense TaxID=1398745 RepID=UPI001BA845A0
TCLLRLAKECLTMKTSTSLVAQRIAAQRALSEKRITSEQYEDILSAIEHMENLRAKQQSNTLKK